MVHSIASCLQQVVDATVHVIEDHIPDELLDFSALLYPLKQISSCRFMSAFAEISHNHSNASSEHTNNKSEEQLSTSHSFLGSSASSRQALSQLRGLEVHATDLCKIWNEHTTSRFHLSHFEWFREKVGARHEFLIFGVEHSGSAEGRRKGLWLRVERRPTEEIKRRRDAFTRLVGSHEAYDLVTISYSKENLMSKGDIGAERVQASMPLGENFTLSYFINVLKIIHDESRTYHLAGANCWFYASTIAEIALCRAQNDWNLRPLRAFDHRKSKEWVNWGQYRPIMERVKML